jgi:hypothetical protein
VSDRLGLRVLAVLTLAALAGCGRLSSERNPLEWRIAATPGAGAAAADLLLDGRATWLAREVRDAGGGTMIEISWLDPGSNPERRAALPGRSPALVESGAGELVLADFDSAGTPRTRRGSADARHWDAGVPIATRADARIGTGRRLVLSGAGRLLAACAYTDAPEIVVYASDDAARSWTTFGSIAAADAADPVLAEATAGEILCVFRIGGELHESRSRDAGQTWSAPAPLGFRCAAGAPALLQLSAEDGLALLWTTPDLDTLRAAPAGQALRISFAAGGPWRPARTFALRPGSQLSAPRLAVNHGRVGTLFLQEEPAAGALVCWSQPTAMWRARADSAGVSGNAGRFGFDPLRARRALRVLAAHTTLRPRPARWLFSEAYFMRGLVAAQACLAPREPDEDAWIDPLVFLAQAIGFADSLADAQTAIGYWHTGYDATYVADMAAAAAVFVALDACVDSVRSRRYVQVVQRFVDALDRDGMFVRAGALGIGWRSPLDALLEAHQRGATMPGWKSPYLVSTALAGIELHGWLARRSGDPRYAERARAALDFTLSQIQPDGSLPRFAPEEGLLQTASYVEEGWMAAARWLEESDERGRLCRSLKPHVGWLLRMQRPDGTWDTGAEGEFARTPAILDFLIWYDRRCESDQDVRRAVRRGGAGWIDLDVQDARGVYRTDKDHEVLRAILGRTLAALASGEPVY